MKPQMVDRLNKEKQKIQQNKQRAQEVLKLFPYELKSIDEIHGRLIQFDLNFFDVSFPPEDSSAFCAEEEQKYPFKYPIHWRRADDFMIENKAAGLRPAQVFYESIEPNDIKQGTLGNCWFMCALASLAERSKLVENLFVTKSKNPEGVYRIKFCKNGEWVEVTIDDYFPCLPFGGPLFSRAHDNEMWVLLIEKAYAKLHGNYFTLRGGFANEGMMDLTGCPTSNYDFESEQVIEMIENGELFKKMLQFDEDGYLLSASTPGEDRWTEQGGPDKQGGLVAGHAYSVIQVKQAFGNRLVNIRNPWGAFEWDGDWSDKSKKWTQQMIEVIQPVLDDADGTFWMSFEDFIKQFKSLNVCRVRNWQEQRIRGKFIRLEDENDAGFEQVVSKWYYEITVHEKTQIFIGLHQEDERIQGVILRRPFIDCGITVLQVHDDNTIELYEFKNLSKDRTVELEVTLEPGRYIILPRTTGALMVTKPSALLDQPDTPLLDREGNLTKAFESVVEDIFRKMDLFIGRELSYEEFKIFYQVTGQKPLTQQEFRQNFLQQYCSTSDGITVRGLKNYIQDSIKKYGTDTVRTWLSKLGYDEHLFNPETRNFTLTFHSSKAFSVTAKDAIQTELDSLANSLICAKEFEVNGAKKDFIHRLGLYQVYYSFSEDAYAYTYAVTNVATFPMSITMDFRASTDMLTIPQIGSATKVVKPGETEYLMHACADPNAEAFVRRTNITFSPIL